MCSIANKIQEGRALMTLIQFWKFILHVQCISYYSPTLHSLNLNTPVLLFLYTVLSIQTPSPLPISDHQCRHCSSSCTTSSPPYHWRSPTSNPTPPHPEFLACRALSTACPSTASLSFAQNIQGHLKCFPNFDVPITFNDTKWNCLAYGSK